MDERRARGMSKLAALDRDAPARLAESLRDVAPDLADYVLDFAFGDVYSRPGLTPPQRQLVALGALIALGGCEPQLKLHVRGALTVGLSPREVAEAVIHTVPLVGFARALNAMAVVREVLAERGERPR